MKSKILFGLVILSFISADTKAQPKEARMAGRPSPQAIIYKTKADYSHYVAVTLSEDKSRIVSYPAPQDVFTAGTLALPTQMPHGFWLDNRGIGPNTCFVKITYEEYAKMSQSPSADDLYKLIIDKQPFTEMYDLGARRDFKDDKEISYIIKKHKLKEYKRLL
jgi:hypothetical protein